MPDLTDLPDLTGATYAVVGSGYMGGGIAQVMALAGATVNLADVSAEVAASNRDRLIREAADFAAHGLFPADAAEVMERNLVAAPSMEDAVQDAEFIEEAVPEKLDLKRATLARISGAASPDAVIGSNTSTIRIERMADAVTDPERFVGVHFSNPAPFIPGVEIIPHAGTSEATVAVAQKVVAAVGKRGALVKDSDGFVLNRLQYALFTEAAQVVAEGVASAEDVDTIVRSTFGFRLPFFGPFAIADMAGLDVYAFCYQSLQGRWPERFATPDSLAELVQAGKLGVKSGGGYLDVSADKAEALVAYRNKAYAAMAELLEQLGEAPLE